MVVPFTNHKIMQNILIAIDAEKPELRSINFGCYLARLTHSRLTGVFLENLPLDELPLVPLTYDNPFEEAIDSDNMLQAEFKLKTCEDHIRVFKDICEKQGVAYQIHRDQGVAISELIAESRYADLIIVERSSFSATLLNMPNGLVFIEDVSAKAECPILVSPNQFERLNEVLFAYDGNASSVFAIKQFTYLFPELKDAKITVLQADKKAVFKVEEKEKLYEYLKAHYSHIDFKDLHGKPAGELFDYTLAQDNVCMVMGAFGRSWLTRLFKNSTADLLLQINNLPVFITHR
jgi:hypothetical protein